MEINCQLFTFESNAKRIMQNTYESILNRGEGGAGQGRAGRQHNDIYTRM